MIIELTQEDILLSYNAALDSVNLLKAGKPNNVTDLDWEDIVKRNKEHLEIQIEKGVKFYGSLDLTPFKDAVKLQS